MARAKVVHSTDCVEVIFEGNKTNPEPSTGVIKFPGGHIEVSRCTNGDYWAHIAVNDETNIVNGRIDRNSQDRSVEDLPDNDLITHIAIRIQNKGE